MLQFAKRILIQKEICYNTQVIPKPNSAIRSTTISSKKTTVSQHLTNITNKERNPTTDILVKNLLTNQKTNKTSTPNQDGEKTQKRIVFPQYFYFPIQKMKEK